MDWLLRYADRAFGVPSLQKIEQYLGTYDTCYLGYATDEQVRAGAASGGIVSALLIHLLENEIVQGAVISKVEIENGEIQAHPFIARSRKEILQAQSSIYMEFPWLREARSLLKSAEGKVAVVGLPCFIQALRRVEAKDPKIAATVDVHIGLICGRSSSKNLLLRFLESKGIREQDVADIRFREGHWRGQMHVWLQDGSEKYFSFSEFSLYRNLHFYCETKCLSCEDPLAEEADVVCGDVWLHELRKEPVKHSLVISRTPRTTAWIRQMGIEKRIECKEISSETVFRAQRRGLYPAKRGKQAKAALGKFVGFRMSRKNPLWSRWNDYVMAAIVLLNYRWTQDERLSKLIFRIPKPLLQFYLIVLSFLKQF